MTETEKKIHVLSLLRPRENQIMNTQPKLNLIVSTDQKFYGFSGFDQLDKWARQNSEVWYAAQAQADAIGLQPDDRLKFLCATMLGVNVGLDAKLKTLVDESVTNIVQPKILKPGDPGFKIGTN